VRVALDPPRPRPSVTATGCSVGTVRGGGAGAYVGGGTAVVDRTMYPPDGGDAGVATGSAGDGIALVVVDVAPRPATFTNIGGSACGAVGSARAMRTGGALCCD
jgi:hypothetical protein